MPFWSGLFTAGASAVVTKKRRPSLDAAAAKLRALADGRRSERTVFWKDYKEFLGNPPQPPAEPKTPTSHRFRARVPLRIRARIPQVRGGIRETSGWLTVGPAELQGEHRC
jgi:hypothetical protein